MSTQPPLPTYELKDPLARYSLPASNRDANLKLAWANSVCLLFLVIGLVGARQGVIAIKPAPPLEKVIPIVVEPVVLPPQQAPEKQVEPEQSQVDTTPVAVVIPQTPNINFSVPTISSLVVPANLASAPPLEPLHVAPKVGTLDNTGNGGERPAPPYPTIALQTGEQGTVEVLIQGDGAGNVVSVEIQSSSGFPILDHSTADFIKRHWRLPTGTGQLFQTRIIYQPHL